MKKTFFSRLSGSINGKDYGWRLRGNERKYIEDVLNGKYDKQFKTLHEYYGKF